MIAKNIKSIREALNINQQAIADFLGIKREMISYYENGSRNIPLNHLEKLCDFFGIELSDLMEENIDMQKVNTALCTSSNIEAVMQFKRIVKNYLTLVKLNA